MRLLILKHIIQLLDSNQEKNVKIESQACTSNSLFENQNGEDTVPLF